MDRQLQSYVVIGAVVAVLLGAGLYLLLPGLLPDIENNAQLYFYVLFLPAAWIFLLTVIAGNYRFLTKAIDPLRLSEDRFLQITLRVLTNSVEQGIVFAAFSLTWFAMANEQAKGLIATVAIIFIVARIVFYLGYLKDSKYRSTGMALTYFVNVYLLVQVVISL